MTGNGALHTREEVSAAINAGADLVTGGLNRGEADTDLIHLVVCAIRCELDRPGLSLDDVIRASYEQEPKVVRGWWDWSD